MKDKKVKINIGDSGVVEIKDFKTAMNIVKNGGYAITDKGVPVKIRLKDFVEPYSSQIWLTKTINMMVREAVQPNLNIKNLFQRVNVDPGVTIKLVKSMSAADIGSLDIADGQTYPTLKLDEAGAYTTVTTGKMGIQFIITEEMKRLSQYDIIKMHLDQASYALARHLEKKALDLLLAMGTVTHDNINPAGSIYGITTGRDSSGAPNGTVTMDDIVEAYSSLMLAGFRPDIIIISPLTWGMWMKDPVLRYFALTAGGSFYNQPSGDVSPMWEGGTGPTGFGDPSNPPAEGKDLLPETTLAPTLPSYFPYPLRVIVSHFLPITVVNGKKLVDIILADSRYIGINAVEEDIMVDQNIDWKTESTWIRIKTKQGFMVLEEGKAIAVIKNVQISDNAYVVSPLIQPNTSIAITTLDIDRSTAVTY